MDYQQVISASTIESIPVLLKQIWSHVGRRRRIQFGLLLILMVSASFAEIVSIGSILPFLGVLTAPDRIFNHSSARPIIELLGFTDPSQLLLPLTLAFGCAAVFAGGMRLLLLWVSTRLSFSFGADVGIEIYRRTLYQPYAVHVSRNSSEVITGISQKATSLIYQIINPLLILVSSTVMITAILAVLIYIEPLIALATFLGFGLIYGIIIFVTRKRLRIDSQRVAHESTRVIQALQEGLGGIRDVLIDGTQPTYCRIYQSADIPLRRAQGNAVVINHSPRYGIEALGMLTIAVLAYLLAQAPEGISRAIPVLGSLALGAQRLLPALQQAYGSITNIRAGQASLQDTLYLLSQPLPSYTKSTTTEPIPFKHAIALNRVSFRYSPKGQWVLRDLSLIIPKGARIGFIGTTGAGKSTLIDLIMALLQPTHGFLEIDGLPINVENQRTWQAHIAHVPQSIFLADTTILENIAFGVPMDQIDFNRVYCAARQAQIAATIEGWPDQYHSQVGERGVRLSGGQRQRIGIARALYKESDVIIFDEATSALDNETEAAVMHAIEGLGSELTVIIVAHRLTTLKKCDKVVELDDGGIRRVGTYAEMTREVA